jgi:deoxyribonuclease-4
LQTKEFSIQELSKYKDLKSKYSIGPHYFHAVYLINLATENKSFLKSSINSLIFYQRLASDIGAVGTILHVGSHKGAGLSETMSQIVASINYILDSSPKGIRLIIENAAGQADTIGATFNEISQIISRVGDRSKIGVCLDTQHAFASGYKLDKLIDQFDNIVGLKHLTVIHLNDSLSDFASRRDRHANLGEGKIGLESIKAFINDNRLVKIPIILEVPGSNNSGPRKKDIDLLKSLVVQ